MQTCVTILFTGLRALSTVFVSWHHFHELVRGQNRRLVTPRHSGLHCAGPDYPELVNRRPSPEYRIKGLRQQSYRDKREDDDVA
jgi:hypothetical protein